VLNFGGGAYLPAGNKRHHHSQKRRELELPARKKQLEILQHASNGEQREAESLPDGGGERRAGPMAAAAPPTKSNRSGSHPASLAWRHLQIGAKEQIPKLKGVGTSTVSVSARKQM
jgi:hypothetical protein